MAEDEVLVFLADKKALVLDKSSSVRNMLERALVDVGMERENIVTHKNFEHALEYLQASKPDIVVTDFELHDKFGLDLIPHINEYTDFCEGGRRSRELKNVRTWGRVILPRERRS